MSVLMRRIVAAFGLGLALVALPVAGTRTSARPQEPTPEQLRALIERAVASQHRNDDALGEFERHERLITRKNDGNDRITDDKLYRVFPTGTGVIRVLQEENDRAVKPEAYEKGLRYVEQALVIAVDPAHPKQKEALAKWEKRMRERGEMLDAIPEAFRFSWLGREARNGRTLAKIGFEPNPDYKPRSRNTHMLTHVRATVWLLEADAQVVRVEAEIFEDIPVGGGLLGKVYKGGRFEMDQVEAAPGVWLPARYTYDFTGRKFIFPFSINETTEARDYRRLGPPKEVLAALRRELQKSGTSNLRPANGTPAQ